MNDLKYTPNYDKVVNFLYVESDEISKRLIECYREYVFNIKNKKSKENIDIVLNEYTEKNGFYKYVQDYFKEYDIYDTYDRVMLRINKLYKEYKKEQIKSIKNARWL